MASLLDTYPLNDAYRERVYPEDQAQHRRSTTPVRADAGALGRLNVLAGIEMSEIGAFRAGQSAYNTGTGWYWEVDPTAGPRFSVGNSNLGEPKLLWDGSALTIVGEITATTGEIGGWEIGASTLTGGDTRLDSTGIIEVGSGNNIAKLSSVDATYRLWVGHDDPASAPFRVQQDGSLSATAGAIGGWTLGTTFLQGTDTTLNANGNITLGTGDNVVRLSASDATYRLWVGDATAGSAPFRVTQAGALTATGVTISGSITATTGGIGGWSIGASTLTGGNVTLNSSGVVTAGTGDNVAVMSSVDGTYRLWVGDATAGSAPFRVTQGGSLTATAGTIGGWTINGTSGITLGSGSSTRGMSTSSWAFFAGSSTPSIAPFRVSTSGQVVVQNLAGTSITASAIDTGVLNGGLLDGQSVAGGALVNGAVDTLQIADAAITNLKVGDVSASKITTGTITSTTVTLGSGGSLQWEGGNSFIDSGGMVLSSSGLFGDSIVWRVSGVNRASIHASSTYMYISSQGSDGIIIDGDEGASASLSSYIHLKSSGASPGIDISTGGGTLGFSIGGSQVGYFDSSGRLVASNIYPNLQTTRSLEDNGSAIGFDGVTTGGSTGTWSGNAPAGASYVKININGTTYRFAIWADS